MWDRTNETDLGRRVAELESQTVDLRRRVAELASRVQVPSDVRSAPVDDHRDAERQVKPAPELVRCEDLEHCLNDCTYTRYGSHRAPHMHNADCDQPCDKGKARCIPVLKPAEPEVVIPDVPVQVGSEAFRRELQRHSEELGHAYLWLVHGGQLRALPSAEHLERLTGIACTLRDAYELARVGEQEAAEEKVKEIEW